MTEATVTTVRERIARALADSVDHIDTVDSWDELADKAIAALGISAERLDAVANGSAVIVPKEPTEAMRNAAKMRGPYDGSGESWSLTYWHAMITAAQEGKP